MYLLIVAMCLEQSSSSSFFFFKSFHSAQCTTFLCNARFCVFVNEFACSFRIIVSVHNNSEVFSCVSMW